MIKVENLHKSFGKVKAVRGISFEVRDGEITGLLGPNGAGKTTTLRMLYGLMQPVGGQMWIDGIEVARVGRHVRMAGSWGCVIGRQDILADGGIVGRVCIRVATGADRLSRSPMVLA